MWICRRVEKDLAIIFHGNAGKHKAVPFGVIVHENIHEHHTVRLCQNDVRELFGRIIPVLFNIKMHISDSHLNTSFFQIFDSKLRIIL